MVAALIIEIVTQGIQRYARLADIKVEEISCKQKLIDTVIWHFRLIKSMSDETILADPHFFKKSLLSAFESAIEDVKELKYLSLGRSVFRYAILKAFDEVFAAPHPLPQLININKQFIEEKKGLDNKTALQQDRKKRSLNNQYRVKSISELPSFLNAPVGKRGSLRILKKLHEKEFTEKSELEDIEDNVTQIEAIHGSFRQNIETKPIAEKYVLTPPTVSPPPPTVMSIVLPGETVTSPPTSPETSPTDDYFIPEKKVLSPTKTSPISPENNVRSTDLFKKALQENKNKKIEQSNKACCVIL